MKRMKMKKRIDNQIGDEGAKSISESLKINTSLTQLELGGDEDLYEMKGRKKERRKEQRNKKEIDNDIGDEGAKSISKSLKINSSLTELDLYSDEKKRNSKEKEDD